MIKYITYFCLLLWTVNIASAQVGIGTTSPESILDIRSSNQATPLNSDGILIPRIDTFPVTNPTALQNGMLVFLTTNNTFYYWNNSSNTWIPINSNGKVERINDLIDGKSDNDGTEDGSSVYLGVTAGNTDDSSDNRNVGIGYQTMYTNSTGNNNTANGYRALYSNTSGIGNIANGSLTLVLNTTGSNNIANGYGALNHNDTGDDNVAIGGRASFSNTTGSNNTAIGTRALEQNSTGIGNVALGNYAGFNETGSNKLYIDNSSTTTPLIYGDFSTNHFRVNGNARITDLSGTGSRMVIANANGDLTTQSIPANGDITGVIAGSGLIGGGTIGNITLNVNANNGITDNANDIRLGGELIQNTTITQGGNEMIFNLNGTGDFIVQDNGTNLFVVLDNGDVRVDNSTFSVDASTNRVGVGITAPAEDLHIFNSDSEVASVYATGTVQGSGMFYAGQSTTYGGGFVYDGDGAPALVGENDRITFFRRNNGIDTDVMSFAHNSNVLRVTNLAGTGNRMVIANANGDLITQSIPANGDITGVTAGSGLTGGGTTGTLTVTANANNGLNVDATADAIQLGGVLIDNTTITQENFGMIYNLNGTGDFTINDAGTPHFQVSDGGLTYFGDNTQWRDGNAISGTIFAQIYDDGDDGHMILYENGATQITLDANGTSVFNEQGLDRDFRIESDASSNMFRIDAANNRIGVREGTPDTDIHLKQSALTEAGTGGMTFESSISTDQWKIYHSGLHFSFAENGIRRAYVEAATGNYIITSDKRLKKNIIPLELVSDKLERINLYKYHYKSQSDSNKKVIGVMAQELQHEFPELVSTNEDGNLGVSYDGLSVVAIKAIQEQKEVIENQNERIDKLEKEIEGLKKLIKSKMN